MANINEGDLLISRATGTKYIATGRDYIKRVAGTGEYLDDWSFIPSVNVINPETGSRFTVYLHEVIRTKES
jgi:hypothetical protein